MGRLAGPEDRRPGTWSCCVPGSAVTAVGINGLLIPHRFVSGGVTGLALVLHYLVAGPLRRPDLRRRECAAFPGRLVFHQPPVLSSTASPGRSSFPGPSPGWISASFRCRTKLLAAILAGLILGTGSGIILKSLGSAGGTDILSVILLQRFSIRLGTTRLAFNILVLAAAALLFSVEDALYTLIYLYVSAQIVNLVVTGLSQRKAIFIISPRWQEISRGILEEIHRGVTILRGQGGYSQREQQILYTVVNFRELATLKQIVRRNDPAAFVVVTDTTEVMGHRIGNQPHW